MHPIPSVLFAVFVSSAFLCSCSLGKRQLVPAPHTANPNVAVDDAGSQHRQLHEIFNRYREAYYELNPMTARTKPGLHFDLMLIAEFNNTYADKLHALEAETLAHLLEIDPNALTDGDRLSLNVFSYDRKMRLEYYDQGFAKLDALMPLDPFDDLPFTFSLNASGVGGQSFATLAEYESWLRKLEKFDGWVAMAITHMRKGLKLGLVHPRSLVERSLEALKTHAISSVEDSIYLGPLKLFPDDFIEPDQLLLEIAYRNVIENSVIPAYKRYVEFLEEEYLPKARSSDGLADLPGGKRWYLFKVRQHTTLEIDPAKLHMEGMKQVKLLQEEMDGLISKVNFNGSRAEFLNHLNSDARFRYPTEEAMLHAYEAGKLTSKIQLPELFIIRPTSDYIILPLHRAYAAYYPDALYSPPPEDGSRPGVFALNTSALHSRYSYMREVISLHEGEPGHHTQVALAWELQHLPAFRRLGRYSAYNEGWALYAESLGFELGLYRDPYQHFGFLKAALMRSCRLTADTGLHEKGWSRAQAVAFLKKDCLLREPAVEYEVDRLIAQPGFGASYKVGEMKIRELRDRAEVALGARFDIREFHRQVLNDAALPLPILESKIDLWIEDQGRQGGSH